MERPKPMMADWKLPLWAWLLGLAAVLGLQCWLTAQLFGPCPWDQLLDERPIVSGAYPQNLYLGQRGAQAIVTQGRTSVLDHYFQALYPITPIFDGGRLAQLLVLVGTEHPASYKIGIAVLYALVPLFIIVACRGIGVGQPATVLAALLGQVVWWGPLGHNAMHAGSCELYLASLAGLAHVGCLVGFHRAASVTLWFGLLVTAALGWYLQPLLFPIALPILLVFYLTVGVRHEFLTWHVAFWTAELFAVAVNLAWLIEWIDSWWLRASLPTTAGLLEHRTFVTVWNAPLWSGSTERLLALLLLLSASLGVYLLNRERQRAAARLLGLGCGGTFVLALLGISWEQLSAVGTASLLAPALWFACVPTAHAWMCSARCLWQRGVVGRAVLAVLLTSVPVCFAFASETPSSLVERFLHVQPLAIGLNADRQAIVDALKQHTSADARILWEDRVVGQHDSRWAALLPLLTERQFIGGLDPDGFIEHSSIGLSFQGADDVFASDEKLQDYCRLYNVRWIVAWTPSVIDRLEEWQQAEKVKALKDGQTGWLFAVKRKPSIALKGEAEMLHADGQSIVLGNVVPKNGEVILSMHYHAGMQASSGRVEVERAAWGNAPIGFIRLRLKERITVVTLTWDH